MRTAERLASALVNHVVGVWGPPDVHANGAETYYPAGVSCWCVRRIFEGEQQNCLEWTVRSPAVAFYMK